MESVIIDCAGITTAEAFHRELAQKLSFPQWYGHNLDALFDCLTEYRQDREIVLQNWHSLSYALKDYAEKALYVFHEASQENPHLTVTIHP